MTMPLNLVLVRHGQSQRNLAGKLAFGGDLSLIDEIVNRPSSVALLTPEGQRQASLTGQWLREQRFSFQRWYTSSFNRAKQTAGLLDLPDAVWYVENNIRERSGGVMEDMNPDERRKYLDGFRNRAHKLDLFNFRPDRGESYADITVRLRLFFDTLHRECDKMSGVCVVNHGDNMWVVRSLIERWTPEDFVDTRGHDAHGAIPNGMVLHYTRVNPHDQSAEPSRHLDWYRTCTPWKDPNPSAWQPIVRRRYSSRELLDQVEVSAARVAQAS